MFAIREKICFQLMYTVLHWVCADDNIDLITSWVYVNHIHRLICVVPDFSNQPAAEVDTAAPTDVSRFFGESGSKWYWEAG